MKMNSKTTILSLLLCWTTSSAFVVQQGQRHTTTTTRTTVSTTCSQLQATIKQAGGGIPLQPAGNRHLFDPALEGKLGLAVNDRIAQGSTYQYLAPHSSSSVEETTQLTDTQHWILEGQDDIPQNTIKPKSPVTATVLGRTKLITDDAPGDIQHIVLELPESFGHYVEGQSISVIPPSSTTSTKPHKPRLYSIASTRYGDLLNGRTVSLCVRRASYVDDKTGEQKFGVCSNFLCNTQPGDAVQVAGPIGKTMLLPTDPTKDIIMVATGTGVAPFRAFLHRLFMENTVARHLFQGEAWLVLGVPTTGGLLYDQEFQAMRARNPTQLRIDYAISREMANKEGGKLYVQDVLKEQADMLWRKLVEEGAVLYVCGLAHMLPGITEALEQVAAERGVDWSSTLKRLKENKQWHVEVY